MEFTLLLFVVFIITSSVGRDNLMANLEAAVAENNLVDIIALAKAGGNINGSTNAGDSLVHLAVKTDSRPSIAVLGFLKADLEALNDAGATPMEEAIRNDNALCIKELVSAGAKIEKRLFRGDTYLHVAAAEGRNKALGALLETGLKPDIENYIGETALLQAVRAKNAEGVDILLQKGANASLVSKNGKSSLQMAVESGNVDIFKELIRSVSLSDLHFENGETLTHLLVRSRKANEMIKALNGRKVQLDTKNADGLAPLHIATDPSAVRTLLDMGADVNVTTQEGETALHIASANGSLEVVKALVQHNAGVNAKDRIGNTPLMNAVKNYKLDVVTFLLFSGADPTIKNDNGRTALHYAAEGSYCSVSALFCVELVTVLLDAGARVNDRDIGGFTPAFVAAINNQLLILQVLVRRGADLNLRGTRGAGIIHEAAYRGHVDIVSYLLDEGVKVDSKDLENAWTALHYAVQRGRKNLVLLLLEREADSTAKGVDGLTPLNVAFDNHRLEVAKLLVERGA